MAPRSNVLIVAGSPEEAEAVGSDVARAWSSSVTIPCPRFTHADAESASAIDLAGFDAAVMRTTPATKPSAVVRFADQLAEAALPGLELASGEPRLAQDEGWVARPVDTDPLVVVGILEALLVRQSEVTALRAELEIATRSQRDAVSEMDRLSDELRLASSVQRGLIPTGQLAGTWCDAAVLFRPATFVSGDIYDIRPVDEDTTAFFLADAVGHGVPAALLTMVISRALRFEWRDGDLPDLGVAVSRLNRELLRISGSSGRFATAVVGTIDRSSNTLSIVNAGHPPPMVRSAAGLEEINATGPLLGVFDDATFDVETRDFDAGSSVVVYSDGFETALGSARAIDGRKVPSGQHLEALRTLAHADESPADAMRGLERLVDGVAGSLVQDDDLTAVAIRRVA